MELLVHYVHNDADRNQCCGDTSKLLESWSEPFFSNHVRLPIFFITAVHIYLQHLPNSSLIISSAMWIIIVIINLSPVNVYGEFEFYLAFCKVSLIRPGSGYLMSESILDRSNPLFFNWWPYSRSWRVLGSRKARLSLLA